MPYDSFTAAAVVSQINKELSGARVERVNAPSADEIVLNLRTDDRRSVKLCLSASSSIPKVNLTDVVKDNPTFENVTKLAINMSDAVIKGHPSINAEVEAYAKASGKPFLDYQSPDNYIDAYSDFYDTIFAQDAQADDKKAKK